MLNRLVAISCVNARRLHAARPTDARTFRKPARADAWLARRRRSALKSLESGIVEARRKRAGLEFLRLFCALTRFVGHQGTRGARQPLRALAVTPTAAAVRKTGIKMARGVARR